MKYLAWILSAVSAGVALLVGFVAFDDAHVGRVLVDWGYQFIVVAVVAWLASLGFWAVRDRPRCGLRWIDILVCLALLVVVVLPRQPGLNVMFDEAVIASTSQVMHEQRRAGFAAAGAMIGEEFVITEIVNDKRPLLFPCLGSLLHDVTGYRVANLFALNIVLTIATLVLMVHVGTLLAGARWGGLLAAGLLATAPVLSENCSGAGLAISTVFMMLLAMLLGVHWLRVGSSAALIALLMTTVVLAQTRYEAALFVFAVALVMMVGFRAHKRTNLPVVAAIVPLLLVPIPWARRAAEAAGNIQFARDGIIPVDIFSLSYLAGNWAHAMRFLFDFGQRLPNSPLLSILGCAALALIAVRLSRKKWRDAWWRAWQAPLVMISFTACVAVNCCLLLVYYWAHWDEPSVSRLTLPLMVILALAVPSSLAGFKRAKIVATGLGLVTAVVVLTYTWPANAGGTLWAVYRERDEIRTMVEVLGEVACGQLAVGSRPDIITTSPQAAMVHGFPAYSFVTLESDHRPLLQSMAKEREILTFQVACRFAPGEVPQLLSTHVLPTGLPLHQIGSYPLIDDCLLIVSRVAYDVPRTGEVAD